MNLQGFLSDFIAQYGFEILSAIILGIATFIGAGIKRIYKEFIDDKKKEKIVKTVVKAVNQMYKDLNGDDKLTLACDYIAEILTEKGIFCSDLEVRMLIEEAVGDAKDAFKNTETDEATTTIESEEVVIKGFTSEV